MHDLFLLTWGNGCTTVGVVFDVVRDNFSSFDKSNEVVFALLFWSVLNL